MKDSREDRTRAELARAVADLAKQVLTAAAGCAREVDDDVVVLATHRLFHKRPLQPHAIDLTMTATRVCRCSMVSVNLEATHLWLEAPHLDRVLFDNDGVLQLHVPIWSYKGATGAAVVREPASRRIQRAGAHRLMTAKLGTGMPWAMQILYISRRSNSDRCMKTSLMRYGSRSRTYSSAWVRP